MLFQYLSKKFNYYKQCELLLTPHPGIYYSQYPIKKHEKLTWVKRFIVRLKKIVKYVARAQHKEIKTMLKSVHNYHEMLETISELDLDNAIIEIKKELHKRGLKKDLICQAFAIIKEVTKRELNMSHYDCQLQGGWIMMQGMIAEMNTGEGKTLTATLPVGCGAMANMPVHVVTVNDYLVQRDAELMRPVYKRLGLTLGYIISDMTEQERKQAYRCDITYCTSQQLVFDFLRDRILLKQFNTDLDFKLSSLYSSTPISEKLLLRGLSFAVVDEADGIFIDESRTPLILSSKAENTQQEDLHREAIWLARQLDNDLYYLLEAKLKQVTLTEQGEHYLKELTADMQSLWRGERRSKILVEQALSALHCYEKDINYFVDDGKVQIIDENTGRSMPDRTWGAGLHQMIEEKEGCDQTEQNQTIARISYQHFFSRYLKLSGMTGTAYEVANELWRVYGLSVSPVPTHKPPRRRYDKTYIYYTQEEKWQAVVDDAIAHQILNRPVLIGTRTVKDSEYISELLNNKHYKHQVLNARHYKQEAEIVASAGQAGRITVATNMAGRGTDIKLDTAAEAAGGLHVICCEKNDSRRIDRQLFGRSARQGDPGSYKVICSLEDDAVMKYFGKISLILLNHQIKRELPEGMTVRPQWLASLLIKLSQRIIERYHRKIRQSMIKVDEKRESMLAFTGEAD
ncbi:Protein translocase subunit SecA [hydrothermal vent metagenome]|uniref:Protein translocase subunit SecA n=1 Tax=hydrothermal vent metagenome TaxID=652676 RepID=A0A3B0WTQ8_9ZZZZ